MSEERYAIGGRRYTRQEIVHKYLHLVKYVAGRVSMRLPSKVDINDLINDGVFGLFDAIEKYDGARSVKFETYAIARINGAILDALRTLDWVPRSMRRQMREFERASEQLESELGRTPTNDELARRMDVREDELDRLIQRFRTASLVSLDEVLPSRSRDGIALVERLEDAESDVGRRIERNEMRGEIARAVHALPPQERIVIDLYYFKSQRLSEIKAALGVSESRVSQIHSAAVARLRRRLHAPAPETAGSAGGTPQGS